MMCAWIHMVCCEMYGNDIERYFNRITWRHYYCYLTIFFQPVWNESMNGLSNGAPGVEKKERKDKSVMRAFKSKLCAFTNFESIDQERSYCFLPLGNRSILFFCFFFFTQSTNGRIDISHTHTRIHTVGRAASVSVVHYVKTISYFGRNNILISTEVPRCCFHMLWIPSN